MLELFLSEWAERVEKNSAFLSIFWISLLLLSIFYYYYYYYPDCHKEVAVVVASHDLKSHYYYKVTTYEIQSFINLDQYYTH